MVRVAKIAIRNIEFTTTLDLQFCTQDLFIFPAQNAMTFLETLKAAAAGPPPPDSNSSSSNFSRVGSHSSLSTLASRTIYGRLKRVPKLAAKPALQSSESSSATDDLSGSEESSSSCVEDADAEALQVRNHGQL